MAFRRVTPEAAAKEAALAAGQAEVMAEWHAGVASDLLKLAEAHANANATLAAVAKWRADQEKRRQRWCSAALMLIGSGDDPDAVCAGLGLGRTALQQAVRTGGPVLSSFADLLYMPRPKRKKEAA
ncbi:hypothetical protein NLB33_04150 [Mycolicibacterium smegmatis]|uniref:hypothetical protein n=1 Tax=Mycolicibacterium smegmatis TaxID=1772 RepID=UPI0020A3412F|nr:hypothetical protein [Mycolicibacterium smegmatis]MCP2622044.1 hypothetical protein [Mycolicibacterium smegmatis]